MTPEEHMIQALRAAERPPLEKVAALEAFRVSLAAAIEQAVAAERARAGSDPGKSAAGLDSYLETIIEAVAAERARCVFLARDWVPADVLADLECGDPAGIG